MFVIAHHVSDDEGEAHPSIDTICREAKLGRSTVIEAIQTLVNIGELSVQRGGKFRGDSNSYTLPMYALWVQNSNPKVKLNRPLRVRYGSRIPPHRNIELRNIEETALILPEPDEPKPPTKTEAKKLELRRLRQELERADSLKRYQDEKRKRRLA